MGLDDEVELLTAIECRDANAMARIFALQPHLTEHVRPCRQPTVHYLLQSTARSSLTDTVECLHTLVAFGATLDVIDQDTGNTVFHSAVCPRKGPASGELESADDVTVVLEYLLRHPGRPSYHTANHLGLTAMQYACRVGNVAAVDAFMVASVTTGPLLSAASIADTTFDQSVEGLPVGLIMGANRTGLDNHRQLSLIAAKFGRTKVLEYLLESRVSSATADRLLHTSTTSRPPHERVALWDVLPGADLAWGSEGSPLHVACSQYYDAAPDADDLLDVIAFMVQYTASKHITADEVTAEAQRVAEPFHDHVPSRVPSAVIQLLRQPDLAGRCSLHVAADGRRDGSIRLMQYLLAIDASLLQSTDRGGRTPLDAALRGGKKANAEWLISQHGVDTLGAQTTLRIHNAKRATTISLPTRR